MTEGVQYKSLLYYIACSRASESQSSPVESTALLPLNFAEPCSSSTNTMDFLDR